MRLIKGLFMLLIGMIGFTAMASTPLTEQKQKTTIVKDFQVHTIVGNVLSFELISVDTDVKCIPGNYAQIVYVKFHKPVTIPTVEDVGRQIKQTYQLNFYKERLTLNQVHDAMEIVENARARNGLTEFERIGLEIASVNLRNLERAIIRVKTNELMALKPKG